MWELDYTESWALKNWCFWTVVLEETLESPLDSKEIKAVNPKEISPEYSLKGLMLKLKLQYFGHLMWRTDSLEKTVMLGKIEGGRRSRRQSMRWLDSITDSKSASLTFMAAILLQSIGLQSQARLSDWTELQGFWETVSLVRDWTWTIQWKPRILITRPPRNSLE